MKLKINCSHPCSQCQWNDTPTPSENKSFDWNLDSLENLYEELQDQTQQKLLEREGEINWYRRQKSLLEGKLTEFQENEEELWNELDYLQDQLDRQEQTYTVWQAELQDRLNNSCQTELKLEELLHRYQKGKASWEQRANWLEIKLNQLKNELNRQFQANRKKKKKLKQTSFRLQVAKQDKQNLQTWKDHHVCSCQESCRSKHDYDTIKQERNAYQTQLTVKDQKIAELETQLSKKEQEIKEKDRIIVELSNQPPLQPLNNPNQSDNSPIQEPNNSLTETQSVIGEQKEELLNIVQQQKETIQLLQNQLKNANKEEVIVKEVENLTTIQQLKNELKVKNQTITQLHLIYLLLLGMSVLFLTYRVQVIRKKNKLKN